MTLIERLHERQIKRNEPMETSEKLRILDELKEMIVSGENLPTSLNDKIVTDLERLIKSVETPSTNNHEPWLIQGNNDFPQNNTYVEPWESMGK